MLFLLFLSNLFITSFDPSPFYYWVLYVQVLFYALSAIGWLLALSGKRSGLFTVPFYFVFMNYCLIRGFIRFKKGQQSVLWEKSLRQAV
jgi:hypothetical protein